MTIKKLTSVLLAGTILICSAQPVKAQNDIDVTDQEKVSG